jgi:uncharacterized protein YbjT (DUF2867 family)
VLRFFETSTAKSGYLRAKVAQEQLIRDSSIPYSIVRATQFFEFVERIADEVVALGAFSSHVTDRPWSRP